MRIPSAKKKFVLDAPSNAASEEFQSLPVSNPVLTTPIATPQVVAELSTG
jgi:hypothetical protein